MMGPAHALGGAAALAVVATVTGQADAFPVWTYGLAAASGLVPDADNGRGTMMNRPYLLPLKLMTFPLWYGADHRGRSHSFAAVAGYGLILAFWIWMLSLAGIALPLSIVVMAGMAGYFSHLALDLINITGLQLLWPLPVECYFPPWRAHGIIPGRFNADSIWSQVWVMGGLGLVLILFGANHLGDLVAASANDATLKDLLLGLVGLLGDVLSFVVSTIRDAIFQPPA